MIEKSILSSGKEIFLLRLGLTTNCLLRCRYCFVRKKNLVMPYDTAVRAIELLLASCGKNKLLMLYGGEPLLYFGLVKSLIDFAQNRAKQLKKQVIVSVATNGILLTKEKLSFFKDKGAKIALSIDGIERCHDQARVFVGGKGSFRVVRSRLALICRTLEQKNISALFGLLPRSALDMYENLSYLNSLGFDTINIEPIQSRRYKWGSEEKQVFSDQLQLFIKRIYRSIVSGKFIFLSSINRQLHNQRLTDPRRNCPFYNNLDVYPEGGMAFSPFLFNLRENRQYIIGSVHGRLRGKYSRCTYSVNSPLCRNCWQDYYHGNNAISRLSDIVRLRDEYSLRAAELISLIAKKNSSFRKYIAEAKKRVFE